MALFPNVNKGSRADAKIGGNSPDTAALTRTRKRDDQRDGFRTKPPGCRVCRCSVADEPAVGHPATATLVGSAVQDEHAAECRLIRTLLIAINKLAENGLNPRDERFRVLLGKVHNESRQRR